ncbi:TPA: hypothetical protein ACU967_002220 [Burkholderia contaminans]|uniref:hypothetical protein n=1 Tax=Burkholderia contaminans TaxID=488447 RepID=UPI000D010D8B|nr:hypothetical protein [Burkholderia contaminans]HDR9065463.1 hypothetical protein [Burkholderia vietnamiensis]MBM6427902.1 hypothetical protein [Burkholderia contaminans]MCA7876733.1 hypothetical protein [Burkholderia contaminans]MDN8024244.1 hypothetical protein [Burkholderia contaminans]PRG14352.1 hypothetical protein C6Q17_08770 [Burkholderia contaminans]
MLAKLMQLITGDDNRTLEPAYAWSAVVIVVGLGLEIYSVAAGKPFDFQAYGIGAVGLLGGLGLSARIGK